LICKDFNYSALFTHFGTYSSKSHATAKLDQSIVDAIDECDERAQKVVVERVSKLIRADVATSVKFSALKEHSVHHSRLCLEEKQDAMSEDVNTVIRQRLDSLSNCHPHIRSRHEEILINKADRTFLWVSLTLSMLEHRRL